MDTKASASASHKVRDLRQRRRGNAVGVALHDAGGAPVRDRAQHRDLTRAAESHYGWQAPAPQVVAGNDIWAPGWLARAVLGMAVTEPPEEADESAPDVP